MGTHTVVAVPYGSELNPNELEPLIPCAYCKQGKKFNLMNFGDTEVESYIEGNLLITDIYDRAFEEDDGKCAKITHCPFCGNEVHEAPDEEPEEEFEEVE